MKKFLVISTAYLVLWTSPVCADIVHVHSQEYSVWARIFGSTTPDGEGWEESYEETSSSPVSGSLQRWTDWGMASAQFSADGGVTSSFAWVSSFIEVDDEGYGQAEAFASASIVFSPLVSVMRIVADNPEGATITLIDLTTATTLYIPGGIGSESFVMSFDPSHVYSINTEMARLSAALDTVYGSLRIESVPEPGAILLLGLGLVGLAGVRRRFRI